MTMDKATTPKHQAKKEKKVAKRRKWKKPNDKPKRPLSAYNFFFHLEREKIVLEESMSESHKLSPEALASVLKERSRRPHRKSHGKIGFISLARTVAAKWKNLEPEKKAPFEEQARKEKERYRKEIEEWKKAQEERKKEEIKLSRPTTPTEDKPEPKRSDDDVLGHVNTQVLDDLHQLRSISGDITPEISDEPVLQAPLWATSVNLGNLYDGYNDLKLGGVTREDQVRATAAPAVVSCLEELALELDDECFDLLSAFRSRPMPDASLLHLPGAFPF